MNNSNLNYRKFAQDNAVHIMKKNRLAAVTETGLDPYTRHTHVNKHSDLLTDYERKFQYKSRLIAPTITVAQLSGQFLK